MLLVLWTLGGVLIAGGLLCMAGGTLGLLRFPDFYTRLHAANVSDVVGGVLVLLGLAVACGDAGVALRLLLLAALLIAVGPTLLYLSAGAAHAGGLAPIAGRHVAPRPGARREESAP